MRRSRKKPQTEPPEELSEHEWALLSAWAQKNEPWALLGLSDLVATCLDHHRHKGSVGSNWLAAARNWIRNERLFRQRRKGNGPVPQQARGRSIAGAADAVARRLGLFEEEIN